MDHRYQAPAASLDASAPEAAIDELPVSDKWKERFRILHKAGPMTSGGSYENVNMLTAAERRAIGFNFLAFLFGGLYYLVKGMPRKAFVMVGFGWLFGAAMTMLEAIFSFTAPNSLYWIPSAVVSSMFANYDYYQKMVMGRHMWAPLSMFESWLASIAFAVLSFVTLIVVAVATMPGAPA